MFYNGANCDIYIGKGAGKKLLEDMRSARKSIKIVSPYLSPFLITELILFQKRDLKVELITTDTFDGLNNKHEENIYKLIIQNREKDEEASRKRENWKKILKILAYTNYGLLIILTALAFLYPDLTIAYGLIPIGFIFLLIKLYKTKIKNKRIYTYWYSQLFPFRVYMNPYQGNLSHTFIHSKIYLIDDKIAYLGSLNFTASGTKHNYETRIRTTDENAIKEIKSEIYQLMNNSRLPEKNIQYWGKELYQEPIN